MSLQQSQSLLSQLNDLIDGSVDSFNESIPRLQKDILNRIQLLLRDLDIRRGDIRPTVANLRKINRLKREIQNAVLNDKYLKQVNVFGQSFEKVTELQTEYFASLQKGFKLPAFVNQLKKTSVDAMVEGLTEAGIRSNITEKAAQIVERNITEGAGFNDLMDEMRTFLTKTDKGTGALSRYTQVLTTDSLNGFAREYNQIVSEDLGMEWFQYTGALVEKSRDFCIALVKKRWIHISEFDKITKGTINGKKVSLAGLKPNTNAQTFRSKAGGYSCNHLVAATNEEFVPKNIREKFAD
ncbi:hypothetical protein LCGC14_0463910 [marine sediment metagenome]|uniref:Phage head morphogenesis domain-containing protein n=1 Tax=marine sediment metagenome TaxID=412755 RepID=A0A0F9VN41_9ZZZZ